MGSGMAERLACDLAARGLVIVSGMARGVDAAAHRGALNAHGQTVAIWGTGVDVTYPKENQKLADQILATGGAILSEFPLGTFPAPQNFPIRNRIISGIAVGVLVIEAGEYSGTRITARCALEQGRDVYAVPGNVTNKLSWGPNTLIKQGAALIATWEDVWEALPADIRLCADSPGAACIPDAGNSIIIQRHQNCLPTKKGYSAVLRADEPTHIDEIVERLVSHLSSSQIFAALVRTGIGRPDQGAARQVLRQSDLRLPTGTFWVNQISNFEAPGSYGNSGLASACPSREGLGQFLPPLNFHASFIRIHAIIRMRFHCLKA